MEQDHRRPRPDRLPQRRTGPRPLRADHGRQHPRRAAPVAGGVTNSGQPDHDALRPASGPRQRQRSEIGKPSRFGNYFSGLLENKQPFHTVLQIVTSLLDVADQPEQALDEPSWPRRHQAQRSTQGRHSDLRLHARASFAYHRRL